MEKVKEIEKFSRRQAAKWYATVDQLKKTAEFMQANNIDYGEAYTAIQKALITAQNNAANYWADYKNADQIAAGKKPTMHNAK